MAQQTAVEWLENELKKIPFIKPQDAFDQAKEMERKQMKEMYLKGIENYDPTFKRKSQWTEVDNMTRRLK